MSDMTTTTQTDVKKLESQHVLQTYKRQPVVFERGDVRFPYVIGCLWNGKDSPPANNADGKNNLRVIRSRSGHLIRLNDEEGKETVEIIDSSTRNSIVIDLRKEPGTAIVARHRRSDSRPGTLVGIAQPRKGHLHTAQAIGVAVVRHLADDHAGDATALPIGFA